METGIIIKNMVIMGAIIGAVFLSQQPHFRFSDKNVYKEGVAYLAKNGDWIKTDILPKVGGEVSKIQSTATTEVIKQKNNIVQNLWENFKNYFSQKFSKTFDTEVK